jgi:hypothetical protein
MEGRFYKQENGIWYSALEVRLPDGTILSIDNKTEKNGWKWYEEPPFDYEEITE